MRYAPLERTVLARRTVEVATRYGTIPVKVALDGDAVRNAAPEYEACAAAAKRYDVPVKPCSPRRSWRTKSSARSR